MHASERQVRRKANGSPGSTPKGNCIEAKWLTRNSAQQKGQAEALTQRAPPQIRTVPQSHRLENQLHASERQLRRKANSSPGSTPKGKCIETKWLTRNSAQQKRQAEALACNSYDSALTFHYPYGSTVKCNSEGDMAFRQ